MFGCYGHGGLLPVLPTSGVAFFEQDFHNVNPAKVKTSPVHGVGRACALVILYHFL